MPHPFGVKALRRPYEGIMGGLYSLKETWPQGGMIILLSQSSPPQKTSSSQRSFGENDA